jgi:hypothetical protein
MRESELEALFGEHRASVLTLAGEAAPLPFLPSIARLSLPFFFRMWNHLPLLPLPACAPIQTTWSVQTRSSRR